MVLLARVHQRSVPINNTERYKDLKSDNTILDESGLSLESRPWWDNPGMGASLSLNCSRAVSATMGCYIMIDDDPMLLTVDHFIDKSSVDAVVDKSNIVLNSPSLSDIDNMLSDLEQKIRSVRAYIVRAFQKLDDHDIDLRRHKFLLDELRPSLVEQDVLCALRAEISKGGNTFELGRLVHRCYRTIRESISPHMRLSSQNTNSRLAHRMDWALFKPTPRSTGTPVTSSERKPSTAGIYFSPETAHDERPCTSVSNIKPNLRVHYGRRMTGRRSGHINAVPLLFSYDGVETQEWPMITDEILSTSKDVEGDSGSWILRESDNAVVGMLWGWADEHLLFTPMRDVFADIKQSIGTERIRLPGECSISDIVELEPHPRRISLSFSFLPFLNSVAFIVSYVLESLCRQRC